jgi:phage tail sheath protein FI
MPEYLAPGVYVEEVSFRAKSIEGVSTSVAGFIGPTRFGPTSGPPELLTSFADFSRIYGGLDKLEFDDAENPGQLLPPSDNYMAHAVRAFFDNGGTKLYVTRVYQPADEPPPGSSADPDEDPAGKAWIAIGSPPQVTLRARFPGAAGRMRIVFAVRATPNLLVAVPLQPTVAQAVSGVRANDVVMIRNVAGGGVPTESLYDVTFQQDETLAYSSPFGNPLLQLQNLRPDQMTVHKLTLTVAVLKPGRFEDEQVWNDLAVHPQARGSLLTMFTATPESRLQYLTMPFAIESPNVLTSGAQLLTWLVGPDVLAAVSLNLQTDQQLGALSPPAERPNLASLQRTYFLQGGDDGRLPTYLYYKGGEIGQDKTGLVTFEDVDEISMVAAPGHSGQFGGAGSDERSLQIAQELDIHCHRMSYRVAVLDAMDNQVLSEVMSYRGKLDSTHAALYYPWVTILDPLDPDGRREINLPPSGYVAGIYARTDVVHGVFKAPANEVVLGAIGFETLLNKAQQDILNPAGVNCFRFFPGRGFRLWGARTISSDPEWKYVSVRRYFAYLEHSIDKGTQWAVFENNGPLLWANVGQTVSDFLFNEWRNGALLGTRPEEAFFVRCDRSTMTQNDLDNGRLVCLIGVAVVKPAEFVIFRIGQFTADRRQ